MTLRIRLSILGLGVAALTACSSAPTRLYSPDVPTTRGATVHYDGPPVRIDSIHLPPSLDRLEIVSEVGRGETRIHEMDRWAAPLPQLVRQTLTQALVARLPAGSVVFPNLHKPTGAFGIDVDILAFRAGEAGWHLLASYTIGKSGAPPQRANVDLGDSSPQGSSAAVIARALGVALDSLAQRIADDLLATPILPTTSAP